MVLSKYFGDLIDKARCKRAMPSSKRALDVDLSRSHSTISALPLSLLIDRFQGRLERIKLSPSELESDPEEVFWFMEALTGCTNLKEFDCSIYMSSKTDAINFGSAMKHMKLLETVKLAGNYASLIPLLLLPNSSLQKITIQQNYDISSYDKKEGFQLFMETCKVSTTLQELTLHPDRGYFDKEQMAAVSQLIRQSSSLQSLEVSDSHAFGMLIDDDEDYVDENAPESLGFLADDLKHNQSLKRFCISGCKYSFPWSNRKGQTSILAAEASAFCTTLRSNYALEDLEISPWISPWKEINSRGAWELADGQGPDSEQLQSHLAEIYFLLALNKAGRGILLGPSAKKPETSDWVDAIANEGDLSVVYFFLRSNPSLCNIIPAESKSYSNGGLKHGLVVCHDAPAQGHKRQRTGDKMEGNSLRDRSLRP